jgi:hypothetical protein
MTQALYYPWIDIPDEAWLKTALLYWDSMRTIVPRSVANPYSTKTGRALQEAGFLVPLRVKPGMEEIEALVPEIMTYLATADGNALLMTQRDARGQDTYRRALSNDVGKLTRVHPDKLPGLVKYMVGRPLVDSVGNSEFIRMGEPFANFYMTLLATRLAERVGATLLTSLVAADTLAV